MIPGAYPGESEQMVLYLEETWSSQKSPVGAAALQHRDLGRIGLGKIIYIIYILLAGNPALPGYVFIPITVVFF